MSGNKLVALGIALSVIVLTLYIGILFSIVSALKQIEVRAEVINSYDPISTSAEPQQSMTVTHQRDLLDAELQ